MLILLFIYTCELKNCVISYAIDTAIKMATISLTNNIHDYDYLSSIISSAITGSNKYNIRQYFVMNKSRVKIERKAEDQVFFFSPICKAIPNN